MKDAKKCKIQLLVYNNKVNKGSLWNEFLGKIALCVGSKEKRRKSHKRSISNYDIRLESYEL